MRYLTLGSIPLYTNGFYLLNEGGLLSWEQPIRSFVNRGFTRPYVGGARYADKPATLHLKILVQGSSRADAQDKMSLLHRELYPTNVSDWNSGYGPYAFRIMEGATPRSRWLLDKCTLSSSVNIESRDGGKSYICTFTVTSLSPYWESESVEVVDWGSATTKTVEVGDAVSGTFQMMWVIENENTQPGYCDIYSGTWTRCPLQNATRQLENGDTAFVRFDPASQSCGWVSSATDWTNAYLESTYGRLTGFLNLPTEGATLTGRKSDGVANIQMVGCAMAKLRYRKVRSLI